MATNGKITADDLDLDLFIKMLKMTTHENDNQALVAMRKANALLLRAGQDWESFAKGKITIVNDPFGSIPTPPPAQAAPPPRPKPQAPPPPKRTPRDVAQVNGWIATIRGYRVYYNQYSRDAYDRIVDEWRQYNALHDVSYLWLEREVQSLTPRPRSAGMRDWFDDLELVTLSHDDNIRLATIRSAWTRTLTLHDYDYSFVESLARRHSAPTKKGKPKRAF